MKDGTFAFAEPVLHMFLFFAIHGHRARHGLKIKRKNKAVAGAKRVRVSPFPRGDRQV